MNFYHSFTIATRKKTSLYHNPITKETINVTFTYLGIEGSPNTFTGIESVTTLDNKPISEDNSEVYSAFLYSSRQFCVVFPVVEFLSVIAFAVIVYLNFTYNKIIYVFGAVVILFIFLLALFILNKYIENLFLVSIPKKKGWVRAYIDEHGDLSYPDEKKGKVVRQIMVIDGKEHSSFVTEEESDLFYNALFGKDGKKKQSRE